MICVAYYYLAICACSALIFPTGTLHFRGSVARATNGEIIVRAFSITSSVRNPPSGFRDPEGFQKLAQLAMDMKIKF